jgi:tetratricopeptide (TPR) repeat protein
VTAFKDSIARFQVNFLPFHGPLVWILKYWNARFQILRSLHAAEDLSRLQTQLADTYEVSMAVAQKVDHIEDEMQEMKSSVDDLKAMMTRVDRNAVIASSADMPLPPTIFIGRDAVVNKIAHHLVSGDVGRSRMFILAPGGMGKTSTALMVMKHPLMMKKFAKEHQFWVPCISANSPSTFLAHLSKYLRVKRQTDHPLDDIVAALKTTEDPRVILLDNFETPWNPIEGNKESVRVVLRALALLPHIAILGTMRSEFPPLDEWIYIPLSHVEPQDSRQIYTTIDPTAGNDPKLDELLNVMGHLPYAVTLMATLGKRSLSSPERLLKRWNETGTGMLSKAQDGMDHSIELSLQFVANSRNAIMLLQVLSMLPVGLEHSHLDFWFPSWQPEAIDVLRDAALVLVTEECRLFVIPVIQSYMNHRNRIPDDIREGVYATTYRFLDLHKSPVKGPNDREFKRDVAAIGAQVINIQALLTEIIHDEGTRGQLESFSMSSAESLQETKQAPSAKPSIQPERLDALLTFAWYQRWTKPHILVAEYALRLAKSADDSQRTAEALFCLGSILEEQHHYQEGISRFDEARDFYLALGDDLRDFRSEMESMRAATSYFGANDQRLSQFLSRWNSQPLSAEISALIHFYSGETHFYLKCAEEALQELQEAKTLLVNLNYHYEAAECMLKTARCFALLGEYHPALIVLDESIRLFEHLGLPDERGLFIKSRCLKGANIWGDELITTLQTALELCQELGKPAHTALVLYEFGEVYVHRRDWAAARLAYRELIKELDGFSDHMTSRILANTENNLLYIEAQESNCSDSSIEFRPPQRF